MSDADSEAFQRRTPRPRSALREGFVERRGDATSRGRRQWVNVFAESLTVGDTPPCTPGGKFIRALSEPGGDEPMAIAGLASAMVKRRALAEGR
jgi:hypothetical protein